MCLQADQILRDAGIAQPRSHDNELTKSSRAGITESTASDVCSVRSPRSKKRAEATVTATEWPDPILTLRHVVGFSNAFPSALMWLRGSSCCIYSSFSTIVIRDFQAGHTSLRSLGHAVELFREGDDNQSVAATKGGSEDLSSLSATESFLWGHGASICGMALAREEKLLASAEEGSSSVRLWDLRRLECVTALKAHARGVHALCFSSSGQPLRLCAVGRDASRRVQIIVWDCSALLHDGSRREAGGSLGSALPIIARQTCDFPVTKIAFSPYEAGQLVSCGKENVRFWRLRNSHLAGSPVVLNEYSRGTVFTDMGFDLVYQAFPSNIPRTRPLYVSSSLGTLLLINYDTRSVVCVYQLHDSAINCVSINEGFCVTGSEDNFLRVWPLDFTDFFLEAQHEAGVASVEVSSDGLCVLVGSRNGAIGMLNISNQRYDTVLRSHISEITTMALTPTSLLSHGEVVKRDEVVTTSRDGTLRIWDAASGQQSYEFDVQKDEVTCLAVSPVETNIVAVGFASGCTRIFAIRNEGATSAIREFQQHQSALRSIQYDRDGRFLYTSAAEQQLCVYDALERAYAPVKMLIADMYAKSGRFCLSSDKKYLATISADQKNVTVLSSGSLLPHSTIKPLHSQPHYANRLTREAAASPKDGLKELLMSGDAQELLVLSKTDRLFVYSMATLQLTQTMPLLVQGSITSLVLSPNLKYLATGGSDGSLCVWRWAKEQRFSRKQQSFVGQTGAITRVCFTSDGASVVATGSSSTIFIWEFHGESGEAVKCCDFVAIDNPSGESDDAAKSYNASAAGHVSARDEYRLDAAPVAHTITSDKQHLGYESNTDRGARCDLEEMSPSLHIPVPSSKPNFRLNLAMDALVLHHTNEHKNKEQTDGASSVNVETSALQLSDSVRGALAMSRVVRGIDPRHVAWSHSSGHLVFAAGSAVVVEDLASGTQTIHHGSMILRDEAAGGDDAKTEIALMRLSPSGLHVAAVSTKMDAIAVARVSVDVERALGGDDDDDDDSNTTSSTCRILLPPGAVSVDAIEFVVDSRDGRDDLLCFSCRSGGSESSQLYLASASTGTYVWSRDGSSGDGGNNQEQTASQRVRGIISIGDSMFVTLSGDKCRLESHELSLHQGPSLRGDSAVTSRTLLEAFSSPIQIARASPADPLAGYRRRYLLCVDNEAFCAVYDLVREAIVTTSQLMLHRSEQRQPRVSIDLLEWVETPECKSIVRGSTTGNAVFVHQFPVKSTRGNASIDWQQVARSGLPMLFHIELDSFPRSLSVDPLRGVGVVATEDGAVSLLVFKDGSPKRVLKQPGVLSTRDVVSNGGEAQAQQTTNVCWALGDTILLTLDGYDDNAISCWVPDASREVARFEARGVKCTAMAVNDAFSLSAAGSILLAGYDDGSVRIFELRDMKLLAQCQLAPRSPQSARRDTDKQERKKLSVLKRKLQVNGSQPQPSGDSVRITHIHSVGSCAAVVILADHRVLLVDFFDVFQGEASCASAEKPKKTGRHVHREQEIICRELALSQQTDAGGSRSSRRTQEQRNAVQVVDVDVKTRVEKSFSAPHGSTPSALTVLPFLLITRDDGERPGERSTSSALVKVFGWSGMLASNDLELLSATDEWRLGVESSPLARFLPSEKPLVIYVSDSNRDISSPPASPDRQRWCFEIRDYLQQRVLRRIDLSSSVNFVGSPSLMTRMNSAALPAQDNQSVESSALVMVADERSGSMLALELERSCAIPVANEAAAALGLRPTRGSAFSRHGNRLALSTTSAQAGELFIGSISFSQR